MSKSKSKNKRKKPRSSSRGSLGGHKIVGKKLVPEFQFPTPLSFIQWDRDLLPEHLWLAGLYVAHTPTEVIDIFHRFMDKIDEYWEDDNPCNGLISDFGHFPEHRRAKFIADNFSLVKDAFVEPIGRALSLYPENPAAWLSNGIIEKSRKRIDPEVEIKRLRKSVLKLLPGKNEHAGFIRVLPYSRVMKSGKVHFPIDFELPNIMVKYPDGCTDDEKREVESFSRTSMNSILNMVDRYSQADNAWAKQFWRKNYDLTICIEAHAPLPKSQLSENTDDAFKPFAESISRNIVAADSYLELLSKQVKYDLYEPLRDEVFAGLMARAIRLYVLLLSNETLWARDTTGIFLRCLVDTLILFGYLAHKDDSELFEKYRKHSEGEEKLLRLHLQEYYADDVSINGETSKDLMERMGIEGQFSEINLGSWSEKNTRQMAMEAGLEKPYRLIFKPASADVHGGWMSLQRSSLAYCREPLHRFHRLPSTFEPPMYINTLLGAHMLITKCIEIAVSKLEYPAPKEDFQDIVWPK